MRMMALQWHVAVLFVVGCLGAVAACDGRRVVAVDAGPSATIDSRSPADAAAAPDAQARCTRFEKVGQALLDQGDRLKHAPRVAFDGSRFAVVWHGQPAHVSSFHGELRFALVDGSGRADPAGGISLGEDDGSVAAALVAGPAENAVVFRPRSSIGPAFSFVRFDARGGTLQLSGLPGDPYHLALSPHPSGYAVLIAKQGGSPEVMVVDRAGATTTLAVLPTAEAMASLWLAQRPGGLAAGLYSANHNGRLALIDEDGALTRDQISVGHADLRSPSFAVLGDGLAAVYAAGRDIELETYGPGGDARQRRVIATTPLGLELEDTGEIALAWTGTQLIAVYPGPVDGQFLVQPLDGGTPTRVPGCLATSRGVSAAWGNGLLAVATVSDASGLPTSTVCVTLMACR